MTAFHPAAKTVEWGTPRELFDQLNAEFGPFTMDVCATRHNAKCDRYYSRLEDGLIRRWEGRVFCNPPYGRELASWVEIAAKCDADIVVALLPARTDTQWFHRWILGRAEIRFLPGRVYFENPGQKRDRAPFPSMVVVWRRNVGKSTTGER